MLVTSAAQMREFGARIGAQLHAGDLVIASGPLGAGKTTLVQGIASGLGIGDEITSPTFVIAREHLGPVRLLHIDAYRLRPDGGGTIDPLLALTDLDLETESAVVVMEWGEGLGEVLSSDYVEVCIDLLDGDRRELRLRAHGERADSIVNRLA